MCLNCIQDILDSVELSDKEKLTLVADYLQRLANDDESIIQDFGGFIGANVIDEKYSQ